MSVYNDYSNTERDQFVFWYKGKDLLPYATAKLAEFTKLQTSTRNQLSINLADASQHMNSDENEKLRRAADKYANDCERLTVMVHEFSRDTVAQYKLGIGDVCYFNIVKL